MVECSYLQNGKLSQKDPAITAAQNKQGQQATLLNDPLHYFQSYRLFSEAIRGNIIRTI